MFNVGDNALVWSIYMFHSCWLTWQLVMAGDGANLVEEWLLQ